MGMHIGSVAPDFTAESTEGPLSFYQWKGDSWAILFSHPRNFTPVCTTELGEVARLKAEFDRRNTKVLGLSVDSNENHEEWVKDILETQGHQLNFPLIADSDRKVSTLYDMVPPEAADTMTVRTVFVIDPQNKIRLFLTYPAPTGRNFMEILRALDSLQLTDGESVATPVNWQHGDEVIILPSIKDESELKAKFPQGWRELRPYLRMTKLPEGAQRS